MCTAAFMDQISSSKKPGNGLKTLAERSAPGAQATDVPLGTGLADIAKTSLLSRRDRIRQSVEGAQ